MTGNCHVRFGSGENLEISSKGYLSTFPKFENMEGMVTVARSRGIRFLFVLQSFSQLTAKYGREVGDIIKTNCNIKIFIGSDDAETRKEFSELCGQKKIKNFSVNTSAENPASSSTGAANQPLITMGMLERLNGNEKGDAIVSVRGYEPIWTKFTPSYTLANVYFSEGKADNGKREAVLFEKKDYVFDITGNGQQEEDGTLDEIESADKGDVPVAAVDEEKLKKLDAEWDKILEGINNRIEQSRRYLTDRDAKAVQTARLENKAPLLYALMEEYDQSTAQKLQNLADCILGELPKMIKLQYSAVK